MNHCRHVLLFAVVVLVSCGTTAQAAERPNILWITSEDNGPHLGCYGDAYADTPHIDGLAKRGVVYLNCWSTAPVCAPARTTLISGLYPPSTGSQHMRSETHLPAAFRMYPQYLRGLGYYCTNNSKEDYNLKKPGQVWDESSRQAHWKNRKPGQPFFAVFNFTVSHESRIRRRPHKAVHDPAKVRVPAYHPDTPEVRQDWAQYYDKVSEMDQMVGGTLKELADAGLADDTIVFYYGDHGAGMPRSKRWPYNSGLSVPLVIYIPPKFRQLASDDYQPGGKTDRLVGFIDLAPTVLSLAGLKPPVQFQGHAFLGPHQTAPQRLLHGFRGRMDERYDMVRVVRDKRYIYIRNYMPHKIYGQFIAYMFQTPTTRVWKQLYDEGKLKSPQTLFWERKPPEELYDLTSDPDEVNNLAESPDHQQVLKRLRNAQRNHALKIRDLGFLPEQEIHVRGGDDAPYTMGHDAGRYPLRDIMQAADAASSLNPDPDVTELLVDCLDASDSAVRFWGALGLLMRDKQGAGPDALKQLRKSINDSSPNVRVIVAQILARHGDEQDRTRALDELVTRAKLGPNDVYVAMLAANALDELDEIARPVRSRIQKLPKQHAELPGRMRAYVGNLLTKTLADLK